MGKGSVQIRRDNACKNGGFFFVMQITHVSEPSGAYSKKMFKFRQNCFANVVSDKKKCLIGRQCGLF